jgi:predicted small lipoprotein YifL
MRHLLVCLAVFSVTGCAALPQSLPPEKFRADVERGAYGWGQQTTTTTTREYIYGRPTGRTFETTTRR